MTACLFLIGEVACSPQFRGSHFINASAEYPDPEDPVRKVIAQHGAWFQETVMRAGKEVLGLPA